MKKIVLFWLRRFNIVPLHNNGEQHAEPSHSLKAALFFYELGPLWTSAVCKETIYFSEALNVLLSEMLEIAIKKGPAAFMAKASVCVERDDLST